MKYLYGAKELPLILSTNKNDIVKWYVDGSSGVHPKMKGHTGGGLTLGTGFPFVALTKQKLNTRRSPESELVAVDNCMPAICWTRYFLESQGYVVSENIVYQDNRNAIQLEKNGKASSSKRTKHINIRYFFVTDRIVNNELGVEWCPTGQMIADCMTKPVQGTLFKQFRDHIISVDQVSLSTKISPRRLGPQECVGKNTNMTSTNVEADTNIKFSNPLTVGDDTNVTGNNSSDILAI
jgi:hypothetical protein